LKTARDTFGSYSFEDQRGALPHTEKLKEETE